MDVLLAKKGRAARSRCLFPDHKKGGRLLEQAADCLVSQLSFGSERAANNLRKRRQAAQLYAEAAGAYEIHAKGSGLSAKLAGIEVLAGAREEIAAAEASAMLDDPTLLRDGVSCRRRPDVARAVEAVAGAWMAVGNTDLFAQYTFRAADMYWQCGKYTAAAQALTRCAMELKSFDTYLRAASMHEVSGAMAIAASLRFAAYVAQTGPKVEFGTLARPNSLVEDRYWPADVKAVDAIIAGTASTADRTLLAARYAECRIVGPAIKRLLA
jgi:hypothetical protein